MLHTSDKRVPLLEVKGLSKHFDIAGGGLFERRKRLHAVRQVDLLIHQGETLGLVGESGCGKSTLGRAVLHLLKPDEGQVSFLGEPIHRLSEREMRRRRKDMQIIFQDPYSSLNPRMRIGEILAEPLRVHAIVERSQVDQEVTNLLELVGLDPRVAQRYPHEFSGGQRQRVGIARALSVRPSLIVADEPVSALDVSIQSQILNLLVDLRQKFELSFLFISHDLAVVEHLCHRVAVMYLGQVVEQTTTERLYRSPMHPYTKALIDAIPRPTWPRRTDPAHLLEGDVPSPLSPPPGCSFSPRCRYATDLCRKQAPVLRDLSLEPGVEHKVACHHADAKGSVH